jgi:hypothetical protein
VTPAPVVKQRLGPTRDPSPRSTKTRSARHDANQRGFVMFHHRPAGAMTGHDLLRSEQAGRATPPGIDDASLPSAVSPCRPHRARSRRRRAPRQGGEAGADVGFATTCPGRRASFHDPCPIARWSRGEFKACHRRSRRQGSRASEGKHSLTLPLVEGGTIAGADPVISRFFRGCVRAVGDNRRRVRASLTMRAQHGRLHGSAIAPD